MAIPISVQLIIKGKVIQTLISAHSEKTYRFLMLERHENKRDANAIYRDILRFSTTNKSQTQLPKQPLHNNRTQKFKIVIEAKRAWTN